MVMGIREDQRRRTREAILVAAATEFDVRGYQATTYASIAVRAGVAKSLVSYHFASKTDFVRAIMDVSFSQEGVFSATPVIQPAPFDELAETTVIVAMHEQSDPIGRAVLRLEREADLIDMDLPVPYVGWVQRCAGTLDRAVALGHLRPDVDTVFEAHLLVAQFVGLRELAESLGEYPGFVARAVTCALDRYATIGAAPAALVSATEHAVAAMEAAECDDVERIRRRLDLPGAGAYPALHAQFVADDRHSGHTLQHAGD